MCQWHRPQHNPQAHQEAVTGTQPLPVGRGVRGGQVGARTCATQQSGATPMGSQGPAQSRGKDPLWVSVEPE